MYGRYLFSANRKRMMANGKKINRNSKET